MKIGDKEFTPKITNRVIWDIEEHFNKEIGQLIASAVEFKTKDMAELIYFTIRDEISWEDFEKEIQLNQYVKCAEEVGVAIVNAFKVDSKKK